MELSGRTVAKVFAITVSGIAINKLSELFDATGPVVIGGSLLALVALLAYEAFNSKRSPESKPGRGGGSETKLAIFSLAALLFGSLLTGIVMLVPQTNRGILAPAVVQDLLAYFYSLVEGRSVSVDGLHYFLHEAIATGLLSVIGAVAALRRQKALFLFAYLVFSISGLVAVAGAFGPDGDNYEWLETFVTWFAIAGCVVFATRALPEFFRILFASRSRTEDRSRTA